MRKWFAGAFVVVLLCCAGCDSSVYEKDREDRSNALVKKAMQLADSGQIEEAIRQYRAALNENHMLARAHLDLAVLLHDNNRDMVDAVYHYGKYLELRPDTEKKMMIADRKRLAAQAFAATVALPRGHALTREMDKLNEEVERLRSELKKSGIEIGRQAVALDQAENQNTALEAKIRRLQQDLKSARDGAASRMDRYVIKTYRVQTGDTLTGIAQKVYGDAARAGDIFKANRDKMNNQNDLRSGQVLIVP